MTVMLFVSSSSSNNRITFIVHFDCCRYLIQSLDTNMSQLRRRQEPWKANERHYCAICNTWMGSDRQSIMIHENGKKHRENLEASMKKRRDEKLQVEKDKQLLASSLKKMEQIAAAAHINDVASGCFLAGVESTETHLRTATTDSAKDKSAKKSEMKSWQSRKDKRKERDSKDEEVCENPTKKQNIRRQLAPDEGHYTLGDTTFLEGQAYYPIFEEDMPVQIWTGSSTMSEEYRKTKDVQDLWKTGIVVKVCTTSNNDIEETSFIISYLKNMNDDDETIEKKVIPNRLRLILGSDDLIPKTVEESRLQLMGGEEVINVDDGIVEIDENTGLTSFKAVTVRKITVSQEVKDERARLRAKRREELEKEKNKQKDIEARKMEEAKHANADDSALGAYDVWGKGGYKGININAEVKLDASDTAKSLSDGKKDIKFKKRVNKLKKGTKKKQIRRAIDSDEE